MTGASGDRDRDGATWAELFERAAEHDVGERDVREALAERRDE